MKVKVRLGQVRHLQRQMESQKDKETLYILVQTGGDPISLNEKSAESPDASTGTQSQHQSHVFYLSNKACC